MRAGAEVRTSPSESGGFHPFVGFIYSMRVRPALDAAAQELKSFEADVSGAVSELDEGEMSAN